MKTKSKKTESRAERNISWIQKACRIPEGEDVGKKVRLRDWQKDIIRQIYDNPDITRRAIISMGRKNAKTALSAFLLLLHLVGPEAKRNRQLYSTAQSKEQAAVIFELAAKVVRLSPVLEPMIQIRDTAKQLLAPYYGTRYKALSAEVSTSFGLGPSFIVHDELGQVRGPKSELYEALETATAANKNPLSIVISTQAPTEADLLSVLIDDAKAESDPKTVLILYSADMDLDPFSEEAIRQANPAYGDFQSAEVVQGMAHDASRMPSREAEYRNLILNQRVEASNPFISRGTWNACVGAVIQDFGKTPVYAGLDLSSTTDLTALVVGGFVGDKFHIRPHFWLPEDGLAERSRLDRVQYDVWVRQGLIETTPGKSIEYRDVAKYLWRMYNSSNLRKVAFDRWGFKYLKPWLVEAGFTEELIEKIFEEFGQGFQSMSPALRTFETLVLNGKLVHDGHQVLNMCAGNAVVTKDPAGNRKLDKKKSRGRIDGMVAAVMAASVAETAGKPEPEKKYQLMFAG